MNKFFVFLCVMLMSVGISKIVNAQCEPINLSDVGNAGLANFGDAPGNAGRETLGQTFSVDEPCTVLTSFTFYLIPKVSATTTRFKAYVMEWNDLEKKAIGVAPLFESGLLSTHDFTIVDNVRRKVIIELELELDPLKQYVAFISSAEQGVASLGLATVDARFNADDTLMYAGGNVVWLFDDEDDIMPNPTTALYTWTNNAWTPEVSDLRFKMEFSSPIPPTPSGQEDDEDSDDDGDDDGDDDSDDDGDDDDNDD